MKPSDFLAACVHAESVPPNVVLVLTDDQGTLDANCYGSTDLITPNIDKLAATGVRFTQACAHTVCCPARAALFTRRHPQRGGVEEWIVKRALGFIEGSHGKPFFLYLPLNLPHYPEQALVEHEKLHAKVKDPARKSYGAMVTTTGHYTGRVVDKLESPPSRPGEESFAAEVG